MQGGSKNVRVKPQTPNEAMQEMVDDFIADMKELDDFFACEEDDGDASYYFWPES